MRYDTRVPFSPRIDTVLVVGFVWYIAIALAAAITVFGATSMGEAISLALLAGLAGAAAALSLKYLRDYLRWERSGQVSAPVVGRALRNLHDDSGDRARAA